jgi:ParB family chromosome partitioning protein
MWCVHLINQEAKTDAARIQRVPVILSQRYANEADLAISQLLENAHRADATPMEKAKAYKALLSVHGLEIAEIAGRLGEDEKTVERYLSLLEAAQPLRKALEGGQIGVTAASTIVKKHRGDEGAQKKALDDAMAATGGRATSRAVQKAAPRQKAPYRTTRGIHDVDSALKAVEKVLEKKAWRTADEGEPFVWQGYRAALKWMSGGDCPWEKKT